ncbi:DUF3040 domain-containing protein [Gordonia polyisoprenivorans]|uniref:DUF3040 domain-containing protein n=1 Tax=Gordonia polyisoprenivorans TaxID=84595 RepID=UPI0022349A5C|nr:DUF3040 domain-containing protein [Gordonia polyisoprenivorans]
MSTLADLLGDPPPLPTTTPISEETDMADDDTGAARRGALLGALIAAIVLAGIGAIVLGIVLGGVWRWTAGAVTAAGIAAIAVPAFIKDKEER